MQKRLPTVACLLLHKQSLCATSFWEAWPCEGTVPLAILQHAAAITATSAVPQLECMLDFNVISLVAGRHCHIALSGFDLQDSVLYVLAGAVHNQPGSPAVFVLQSMLWCAAVHHGEWCKGLRGHCVWQAACSACQGYEVQGWLHDCIRTPCSRVH